jgi:transposase
MNLFAEPEDHAIGRSRGGLSTKIHALVDGNGRPLVLLVAPGQGGDAPMFTHLMDQLKINRAGPGRPRTRPDRLRGDKAYSSRAIRSHLRDRGITAVIPQPSDQIGTPETTRIRGRQTSGLRQRGLQRPQRGRTELQHFQAVASPGNPPTAAVPFSEQSASG